MNIKDYLADIAINEFGIFKPLDIKLTPMGNTKYHDFGINGKIYFEKDIKKEFNYDFFYFIAKVFLSNGYGSKCDRFVDHIISRNYILDEYKTVDDVKKHLHDELQIKLTDFIQAYGTYDGNDSNIFIQTKNSFIYLHSYQS